MSRIITAQTLFAFVYIPLVSLIFAKRTILPMTAWLRHAVIGNISAFGITSLGFIRIIEMIRLKYKKAGYDFDHNPAF